MFPGLRRRQAEIGAPECGVTGSAQLVGIAIVVGGIDQHRQGFTAFLVDLGEQLPRIAAEGDPANLGSGFHGGHQDGGWNRCKDADAHSASP